MLDDFFMRSIIGGVGVATVVGPLGCFVVWRRLAYFWRYAITLRPFRRSSSLAITDKYHSSVFITSVFVAFALLFLQKGQKLSSDTLLGLLAHSTIALGLIALSFMTWVRVDLMGFLFGDILSITKRDILIIWAGGLLVLICSILIWKKLLPPQLAQKLLKQRDQNPQRSNFFFMIMLALVIAISMKIVGVMLLTALLIIPAASARHFSTSPEQMVIIAILFGISSSHLTFVALWNLIYQQALVLLSPHLFYFYLPSQKNLILKDT